MSSSTSSPQAQRRHDLLLASQLLRQQMAVDLDRLEPAANRVLLWVNAGWWLRRHWPSTRPQRRVATLLAMAGGLIGSTGIAAFALRRWRWLRNGLVVWRLWRRLRTSSAAQ